MSQEYLQFINDNGIYLEQKLGVKEWALNRDNAIKLLKIMRNNKIPCLGGDVLIEDEKGSLKYTYDNWYYKKDKQTVIIEKYVENSILEAIEYIKNYPEREGGKYYYVIV